MIINKQFVEFDGPRRHGGQQITRISVNDIEALVTHNAEPAEKFFVVSRSGNSYPITDKDWMKLERYWQSWRSNV